MKFNKPALTVDKQLDLLRRRGMAVADRAIALHRLEHISYYRLRASLLALLEEHPAVDLAAMGFPDGWQQAAIWQLRS